MGRRKGNEADTTPRNIGRENDTCANENMKIKRLKCMDSYKIMIQK